MTLSHPHGQIYGYPYLPPRVERVLASVRRHRAATGGDLFAELRRRRAVRPAGGGARNEHWTAFVPAAARWPYEVQLFPTRQGARHPRARPTPSATPSSPCTSTSWRRFARRFDAPMPYIAAWNQAPVGDGRDDWWLHLQLFSCCARQASSSTWPAPSRGWARSSPTQPRGRRRAAARRGRAVSAEPGRASGFAERFGAEPEGVWAAPAGST